MSIDVAIGVVASRSGVVAGSRRLADGVVVVE